MPFLGSAPGIKACGQDLSERQGSHSYHQGGEMARWREGLESEQGRHQCGERACAPFYMSWKIASSGLLTLLFKK